MLLENFLEKNKNSTQIAKESYEDGLTLLKERSNEESAIVAQLSKILKGQSGSLLDVGCGSGRIASTLSQELPKISITAIDSIVRLNSEIDTSNFKFINSDIFDFREENFDFCLLSHVLPDIHPDNRKALLKELSNRTEKQILVVSNLLSGAFGALQRNIWRASKNNSHNIPYTTIASVGEVTPHEFSTEIILKNPKELAQIIPLFTAGMISTKDSLRIANQHFSKNGRLLKIPQIVYCIDINK